MLCSVEKMTLRPRCPRRCASAAANGRRRIHRIPTFVTCGALTLRQCYSCSLVSTAPEADGVLFHSYGSRFQCGPCQSSYRYVRDKVPGWEKKSQEERLQWILANRDSSRKRGQKRILQTVSSVEVADYRGQEGATEYLNEIRSDA